MVQSRRRIEITLKKKNWRDIVKDKLMTFLRDQDGLTIVEYAVAAGLITATVAGAFFALGGTVEGIITTVDGFLQNPAG